MRIITKILGIFGVALLAVGCGGSPAAAPTCADLHVELTATPFAPVGNFQVTVKDRDGKVADGSWEIFVDGRNRGVTGSVYIAPNAQSPTEHTVFAQFDNCVSFPLSFSI